MTKIHEGKDNIFEVIKEHNIVILIPNHGTRLAVEIFPYEDGAVFFDVGWPESSGHPMHVLPGPIEGRDGYWTFGDYEKDGRWIGMIYDLETYPIFQQNNDTWERYKRHEDGKDKATRERAYEFFKEGFGIK